MNVLVLDLHTDLPPRVPHASSAATGAIHLHRAVRSAVRVPSLVEAVRVAGDGVAHVGLA